MDPFAAVTSALTSIRVATDIAKLITGADLSLEKAELKLKLAELIGALADAKIQVADIKEIMLEKDTTINDLKQQMDVESKMQYRKPHYWRVDDKLKDGPFCAQCWDKDKKAIRLIDHQNGVWTCPTCKNTFIDSARYSHVDSEQDYDPLNYR